MKNFSVQKKIQHRELKFCVCECSLWHHFSDINSCHFSLIAFLNFIHIFRLVLRCCVSFCARGWSLLRLSNLYEYLTYFYTAEESWIRNFIPKIQFSKISNSFLPYCIKFRIVSQNFLVQVNHPLEFCECLLHIALCQIAGPEYCIWCCWW